MCLAVPGQIQEIYEANGLRMGKVNFGGVVKDVCLAYVPAMEVGEYTIVHVGFAISQIDEASALQTLQLFEDMGILAEQLGEEPAAATDQACFVQPAAVGSASKRGRPR